MWGGPHADPSSAGGFGVAACLCAVALALLAPWRWVGS